MKTGNQTADMAIAASMQAQSDRITELEATLKRVSALPVYSGTLHQPNIRLTSTGAKGSSTWGGEWVNAEDLRNALNEQQSAE